MAHQAQKFSELAVAPPQELTDLGDLSNVTNLEPAEPVVGATLHLAVPIGIENANQPVRVVIEAARKPMTRAEWGAFVRSMAGSITDPTFEHPPQLPLEVRERSDIAEQHLDGFAIVDAGRSFGCVVDFGLRIDTKGLVDRCTDIEWSIGRRYGVSRHAVGLADDPPTFHSRSGKQA